MTLQTALVQGTKLLEDGRIAAPRLTAEVLLTCALGRERTYLYAHPEEELREVAWIHYGRYLHERLQGKPTQYITGRQEFYGREFRVTRDVLIPRPETEHLVESALARIQPGDVVLDVGSGSGAIAVTLALETAARILATDISLAALCVARSNAQRLSALVSLLACDLASAIANQTINVLVSNPPYVPETDQPVIQREVRDWEPHVALFGGPTGLEIYERLIAEALRVLRRGGWLLLELGYNSVEPVRAMLQSRWSEITVAQDLAGFPRTRRATTSMRTYFHVDMDAFFVSVEELFDSSLKGKPVVVGDQANQRGVVSAASYAARTFGVHSAMPLRTAYRLCPQAIFVDGHPDRYRDYSRKVYQVLKSFSPQVEMASVDEAYMDLTGTERLHGPPLAAAHGLHAAVKHETQLNCSIGIAAARMVAKVASDQAKPNGVLWVLPGQEASFLAPLDIRKIPGVGKVTEKNLQTLGIRKVGDLAQLDEDFLTQRFGRWGLALAGKSHGLDAGGWFDGEVGEDMDPKSISHEFTFNQDTADLDVLESTLARLSEMVGRRLREHRLYARTIQLKLRYSDFSTITRAHSLDHATELDTEIFQQIRTLFRQNLKSNRAVRLLGVHASGLEPGEGQLNLLNEPNTERWRKAFSAVDQIRDKFGEDSVSLATGLKGRFRERVHENPAGLPGKTPREDGALPDEGNYKQAHLEMKQLVEDIAKALVDLPDQVSVKEVQGEQVTVLELRVAPSDLGKVIGKQGRTARSIRTLLGAAGMKLNRRFTLEILE